MNSDPRSTPSSDSSETNSGSDAQRPFISYAHGDVSQNASLPKTQNDVVFDIYARLKRNNLDCWLDRTDIRFGHEWRQRIIEGLNGSYCVLAFINEKYVRESEVCRREMEVAEAYAHVPQVQKDLTVSYYHYTRLTAGLGDRQAAQSYFDKGMAHLNTHASESWALEIIPVFKELM